MSGRTLTRLLVGVVLVVAIAFIVVGEATAASSIAARLTEGEEQAAPSGLGIFMAAFSHVVPHELWGPIDFGNVQLTIYNIQVVQVIAVILMLLVFGHVRASLARAAAGARMGWTARIFSGFVMFIRDEMVIPQMGEKEGKAFLPYFLFVFFFIAFMNLLGLVPHSLTATASIWVTAALAATTLVMMVGCAIQELGVAGFFKSLVPHGLPSWLVPLMFVVEFIGVLMKPFALMIRLFANLLGGHLVVLSFMCLIFFFAESIKTWAYAIAPAAVGLAVFIMIIEGFIALLQAYIFTYLSILFVNMYRHPDH